MRKRMIGQERTQQFLLRWCADGHCHDIARQQYNCSSPDSCCCTAKAIRSQVLHHRGHRDHRG